MFPLGTLVFPGSTIPLHIFEPRYRQLTRDCLARDRSFGIVLIARGSEVGGGDVRTDVGTKVTLTEAVALADGRWLLAAQGVQRIRIREWLGDDPYPEAVVEDWPDRADPVEPGLIDQAVWAVRRIRALLSETSGGIPALASDVTFADDPVTACWQLCAEAPITAYDAQRLLSVEGTSDRLSLFVQLMSELEVDVHRMLMR